jgi:hypothetical protein
MVLLLVAPAPAQQDFRRLLTPPETPQQFWDALMFEINIGKFDIAAVHLKGLLDSLDKSKDKDDEVLKLEKKEGLAAFLRLRLIAKWSEDAKVQKEAKDNVEALLQLVTTTLKKHLKDPERIARYTKKLSAPTREEREYALQQLQRSGSAAIPHLVAALRDALPDSPERRAIRAALPRLYKETVPPLLAALDIKDDVLRAELFDVFHQRADKRVVPYLWYLSAAGKEMVGRRATDLLVYFLGVPAEKLPDPKVALTDEAERYYRHKAYADAPDPKAMVTVWRWDEKEGQIVSQDLLISDAEEYYGLRFARQALDLDATYRPAQTVLLSLALDKASGRAGLDQPLPREARELLSTVNPELVTAVLDRALTEHRGPVILGAVRALGDLGEVRAARPPETKPPSRERAVNYREPRPVLVRALNYPDRRVQLAAADALLRIPGPPAPLASVRVVDVLRRAVAAEPDLKAELAPKLLVADFNTDQANAIAQAARQAGFDVAADDIAHTGREVLRRLAVAGDVDALLLSASLPDPQLPYLMSELRADSSSGLLPIFVLASREQEDRLRRFYEKRYRNVWVIPDVVWRDPEDLKKTLLEQIGKTDQKPLSKDERKNNAGEAMRWLNRMAVGEVRGYDVRLADRTILKATQSDELGPLAIEATGRLPGEQPQRELARVVLDNGRDVKLRAAAAYELGRHIQQHRNRLTNDQVKALQELFAKKDNDPKLQANLAIVVGSLRPDATRTGQRLKDYVPPAPPPPPPPPAPKEK